MFFFYLQKMNRTRLSGWGDDRDDVRRRRPLSCIAVESLSRKVEHYDVLLWSYMDQKLKWYVNGSKLYFNTLGVNLAEADKIIHTRKRMTTRTTQILSASPLLEWLWWLRRCESFLATISSFQSIFHFFFVRRFRFIWNIQHHKGLRAICATILCVCDYCRWGEAIWF